MYLMCSNDGLNLSFNLAVLSQGAATTFTPAQLAKRSPECRQYYALSTFIDAKLRAYEQALIRQYNALGYAEDEIEVTNSDSEEDATVVQN